MAGTRNMASSTKVLVSRQSAPYSPEFEPDIVLTQPHASGVDETLHTLW